MSTQFTQTNERSHTQKHETAGAARTPATARLLQRKCACGGSPGLTGECSECSKKRLILQQYSASSAETGLAPPVVHEVLRSPGQSLDGDTRALMESRFGHDFSQVRVHMDAKAAESAQAVNALAYTVGRDVVFGTRQYAPGTTAGDKLLAHELTHIVQQRGQSYSASVELDISHPSDPTEVEAARATEISGPEVGARTSSLRIQRQKAAEFPGFSQADAVTCGAASLVTALMICGIL